MAINKSSRAPYTMREKISWPNGSVPIQNSTLGGSEVCNRLFSRGPYGATKGAKIPIKAMMRIMLNPTMVIGLRRKAYMADALRGSTDAAEYNSALGASCAIAFARFGPLLNWNGLKSRISG